MCDTRRSRLGTVHTLAAWMHTAPAWVHASPAWIAWIRYIQLSLNTHGDRHGPRGRSRRSWTPRPPPPTTSRALSCRAASRSASRLVAAHPSGSLPRWQRHLAAQDESAQYMRGRHTRTRALPIISSSIGAWRFSTHGRVSILLRHFSGEGAVPLCHSTLFPHCSLRAISFKPLFF